MLIDLHDELAQHWYMELSGSVLEWDRPRPPAMNIDDVQHLAETLELVRAPQVHEVDLEVRAWSWCHDRAEQSTSVVAAS